MHLPERLLELKGRWLTAYKVLWWAMLLVSLVAVTAGQWQYSQQARRTDLQIYAAGLRPSAEGELLFGPLSESAGRAGIVPDSKLVAIDGKPLAASADITRIGDALDGPAGQPVTLRLRAPGGREIEATVVRGPEHLAAADADAAVSYDQRTLFYLSSGTLGSLIVMIGAFLLFRRRPNEPVAALLSLGLLAVPANDIAALVADPGLRRLLDNGLDVVPMACNLLGLATFPAGRFTPRWTLLVIPAILNWAAVMMIGGNEAPLWLQFSVAIPALLLAVISLAWRFVRMDPGPPRQQVKWVMLGFAGFIATGVLQFGLLFAETSRSDNATHFAILVANGALNAIGGFCIVGGILVALLRHRLYDADAAISRSALYAVLTVTLIAVFAASETLIQSIGAKWFGTYAGTAGGAFAAGVAALLLVPLHQRLSKWAEKRFQRDLAQLQAELPVLLAEVRNSNDPREFADNALQLVMRGVHANHGAILLRDGGRLAIAHAEGIATEGLAERLAAELPDAPERGPIHTHDPLLPLRVPLTTRGGVQTGWIVLGPHPDGSFYGKDDRQALADLAPSLARAIELAIERARREAEHAAERHSLTERLAQLEQQLAQVVGLDQPPHLGNA